MDMEILTIKQVRIYDFWLLISYWGIRWKVYIRECKRKITDEFIFSDITANHYILLKGKQGIGIARVICKEGTAELGRIAIVKEYRNHGYGTELINQMITKIENSNKAKIISLFATEGALITFYKKFGFIEYDKFYFNDIPHINMVKRIDE